MAKWTTLGPNDPFPDPPRYALQRMGNNGISSFAIFPNLSLVKTAVTNDCRSDYVVRFDYIVYEWDDHGWQEIYSLSKGDNRLTHDLWAKGPAPKDRQTVNSKEVDAAIASIMNAG